MKAIGALLAFFVIFAVGESYFREEPFAHNQAEFIITSVKPPPNLQLSFKSVAGGWVYNDITISKTCSGWKRIEPGTRVWLTEASFRIDGEVVHRLREPSSLISVLYCQI